MGLIDKVQELIHKKDTMIAQSGQLAGNQSFPAEDLRVLLELMTDVISEGLTMAIDVIVNGFPYPPEDLGFALDGADIDLTWRKAQGDVTGHRVYRSTDDGPFSQIGSDLLPTDEAYTDVAPAAGHVYQYYVVGFNTNGESGKSNTLIITIPAP